MICLMRMEKLVEASKKFLKTERVRLKVSIAEYSEEDSENILERDAMHVRTMDPRMIPIVFSTLTTLNPKV
jgi:hypothetical protein